MPPSRAAPGGDSGGGPPKGACTPVPRPERHAPSDRGPPRRAPRAPIKSSNIQCRRAVPHPAAIRGGGPQKVRARRCRGPSGTRPATAGPPEGRHGPQLNRATFNAAEPCRTRRRFGEGAPKRCVHAGAAAQAARAERPRAPQERATGPNGIEQHSMPPSRAAPGGDSGGGPPKGACTPVPRPKRHAPSDRGPPRRAPRAPMESSNIQCRRAVPRPPAILRAGP